MPETMSADVAKEAETDGLAASLAALDSTPLFASLPPERRRDLAEIAQVERVLPGERIVTEGSPTAALFVIVEGEVEIDRQAGDGSGRYRIRKLGRGETFGELALFEETPASASVYATAPTTLLALPLGTLRRLVGADVGFQPLYRGLAGQLNSRLRSLTDMTVRALESEVEALHARVVIGKLFLATVVLMSVFAYLFGFAAQLTQSGWRSPEVFAISLLGCITVAALIRSSSLPLRFWGFTTEGWRAATRDALVYSVALIAVIIALKWIVIHSVAGWRDAPLLGGTIFSGDIERRLLQDTAYVFIVVPLQEIVIRGCIQGTLSEFLTGPHRSLWAIFTSNLIFSSMHTQISPQFALVAFLGGLLWGWLYARRRTLVGPIISHALLGMAVLSVIGLFNLVK